MKRPKRLTPVSPPLRPATATPTVEPTGLQIAAIAIDELTTENELLRASMTRPALAIESKLFAELMTYRDLYEKELKKSVKWRLKFHDADHRNALLEDRLMTLHLINEREKA
jgi:hypothetical protein